MLTTTTTATPAPLAGRALQRAIAKTRRRLAARAERCSDDCPGWCVMEGNLTGLGIQVCNECFHSAIPDREQVYDDDVAILPEAIEALRAYIERAAGPRAPVALTRGLCEYILCALDSHLYEAAPSNLRRNGAVTDPRRPDGTIDEDEDGELAELCSLIDTNAEIEALLRAAIVQIEVLAAAQEG